MKSSRGKPKVELTPEIQILYDKYLGAVADWKDMDAQAQQLHQIALVAQREYEVGLARYHRSLPYLTMNRDVWYDSKLKDVREFAIVRETEAHYICVHRADPNGQNLRVRKSTPVGATIRIEGDLWTLLEGPKEGDK